MSLSGILRSIIGERKTETFYLSILDRENLSNQQRAGIYYTIAVMRIHQGDYHIANQYLEKTDELLRKKDTNEPSCPYAFVAEDCLPLRLNILSNMGLIYQKRKEYNRAVWRL